MIPYHHSSFGEAIFNTFLLIFLSLCTTPVVHWQSPEWLNFSNGQVQMVLADKGNVLWIGTGGGLVRFDKTTGDRIFNNSSSGLPATVGTAIVIDERWLNARGEL